MMGLNAVDLPVRTFANILLLAGCVVAGADAGHAASLQVMPALVDVTAPAASQTIRLSNRGSRPVNVQIRIFRWVQSNGKDQLVKTRDVVVSPPFAGLAANDDYVVRIVRVSKRPVIGEESYRLLIDELPSAPSKAGNAVNFVMRYSIPVFFRKRNTTAPRLTWSVVQRANRTHVTATNAGGRRVRVSSLQIESKNGNSVVFSKGLVGYVLGRSAASWSTKGALKGAQTGTSVMITAQGDNGPIRGTAKLLVVK